MGRRSRTFTSWTDAGVTWTRQGMLPRRSNSVWTLTAALVLRKVAQGNSERQRISGVFCRESNGSFWMRYERFSKQRVGRREREAQIPAHVQETAKPREPKFSGACVNQRTAFNQRWISLAPQGGLEPPARWFTTDRLRVENCETVCCSKVSCSTFGGSGIFRA